MCVSCGNLVAHLPPAMRLLILSISASNSEAITMHMMKILDPTSMLTEDGKSERQEAAEAEFPYEVYVLLDI